MGRPMCYACMRPQDACLCAGIRPIQLRSKIILLMHPMEYRYAKAATGRLTHLALAQSEIHVGIGFDEHPAVQELIHDPANYPVLLYPGPGAVNLSGDAGPLEGLGINKSGGRCLVVFLLDATWPCAKKMFRLSPSLQALPKLMFTPSQRSRYLIKRQPKELCLSTLEATHELLLALEASGLDVYPDKEELLSLFDRMQDYQIACARDPNKRNFARSQGLGRDYAALREARKGDFPPASP